MKLFIWHRAATVTNSYHDEAGVVVLAHSIDQARAIFEQERRNRYAGSEYSEGDWQRSECGVLADEPDEVVDMSLTKCWIFPDAGCC